MTIERISAVMITRDAAATLAESLDSLAAFAEVVVFFKYMQPYAERMKAG